MCKKNVMWCDVGEMSLFNRLLALGSAAAVAFDHLGDLLMAGIVRRDMKVIAPLLAALVLLGSTLSLMFRSETVKIVSEPVDRVATKETMERLKLVDGSFESDANDELASIKLSDSEISKSGWELISKMKNLKKLVLNDCQVTDSKLPNLQELGKLRVLGLAQNPVTDRSVDDLSRFNGLRALDIQGTLITRQGVVRLRAALPGCAIVN